MLCFPKGMLKFVFLQVPVPSPKGSFASSKKNKKKKKSLLLKSPLPVPLRSNYGCVARAKVQGVFFEEAGWFPASQKEGSGSASVLST